MALEFPPEVLAACMQRGIPPTSVKGFEVTDVDVFLAGPTGRIRIEISSLPEKMLEFLRTQQVQVGQEPERAERATKAKRRSGAVSRSTSKRKKATPEKRAGNSE